MHIRECKPHWTTMVCLVVISRFWTNVLEKRRRQNIVGSCANIAKAAGMWSQKSQYPTRAISIMRPLVVLVTQW